MPTEEDRNRKVDSITSNHSDLDQRGDGADPQVRDRLRRLEDLERENALLKLERDWDEESNRLKIHPGRGGVRSVPTVAEARMRLIVSSSIVLGVFLGNLAGGISILFAMINDPFRAISMSITASIISVVAVSSWLRSFFNLQKARAYEEAHARYLEERDRLLGDDNPGPPRDEGSENRRPA